MQNNETTSTTLKSLLTGVYGTTGNITIILWFGERSSIESILNVDKIITPGNKAFIP
jgi:hypothetical protein